MEFFSVVNWKRHDQNHSKKTKANMASISKVDIGTFWDELTDDEACKILSIEDIKIEGLPGKLCYWILEMVKPGDECYSSANKMKSIIDCSGKTSAEELFSMLDEASEETALSMDIRSCPDKTVLSEGIVLLREVNNVLACCSYLLEKKLVTSYIAHKEAETLRNARILLEVEEAKNNRFCGKHGCSLKFCSDINYNRHNEVHSVDFNDTMDFMVNRDDIGRFWDDLTSDQARQILSLTSMKIEGFSGNKLIRELRKINPKNPFGMNALQLKDIINSSEKPTSTKLFDVLDKTSEETLFCTNILSCSDDIIVKGSTTKLCNVIACISYMLEKNLVEEWFDFKANKAKEPEEHSVGEERQYEQSGAPETKVDEERPLDKSDTEKSGSEGDKWQPELEKRCSLTLTRFTCYTEKPGAHGARHPGERMSLEEFVRNNKLTKIYKIGPKKLFKILKKILKKSIKSYSDPLKRLKKAFKLSLNVLTYSGRRCARGYMRFIIQNHRHNRCWNGQWDLSDMEVIKGEFVISKDADLALTGDRVAADFNRYFDLLLLPYYYNTELASHPLYFDELKAAILKVPDPVTKLDQFVKFEKYMALHFAFMPPLSRSTLLLYLYKVYESIRFVPQHSFEPLNQLTDGDWREHVCQLPVLKDVYFFNVLQYESIEPYSSTYYHLLTFLRHFTSHDLDHTKILPDIVITDIVLGQLLAFHISDLMLLVVQSTNMEGRFFSLFHAYEASDGDAFICVEDDADDVSEQEMSSDESSDGEI